MKKKLREVKNLKVQIEKGFEDFLKLIDNFKKSSKERITFNYVDTRLEILENQTKNFSTKYEDLVGEYEEEDFFRYFQVFF